jgi:basic membrane lipoprotein Med (substrate-binding protein (PBP1-ABC) superfamily)
MGMKDGVVSLVLNPQLESRIPSETQMRVTQARDAIITGTLKVPTAEF